MPPFTAARPPCPPTPLVDRVEALAAIVRHLGREDVRLLTLTGPAGIGKTRLAIAAARAAEDDADRFTSGAVYVDLSAASQPVHVLPALAAALAIQDEGGDPLQARICAALRRARVLLVLDNFEQVCGAAALVGELLEACPGLVVLATSRCPLHLRWEHRFPVPPLELPDLASGSWETWATSPAVTLFVQRARAVRPDFRLDEENARSVAELCLRLDGLPLAIELAAARTAILSPAAILARIDRRLDLLESRDADLPARHRSLRAATDWSFALLSPAQQRLFCQVSLFGGRFTLQAAQKVAAHPDSLDVLDLLASLVDQSLLLQQDGRDGEPSFYMQETVRAFARERFASEAAVPARDLSVAQTVATARATAPLTPREREVAGLVAAGRTNRQIAGALVISERTAEAHVEHIRGKLGVRSRAQIASWAVATGLEEPEAPA